MTCNRLQDRPSTLARDTRGAVLVLGIVFGALLVGALWYIASLGDAIIWRERAQDAADAAAFENAVWHARGMNVIVMINIVMSAVLSILVIWRILFILVTIALVLATILCVVSLGTVCEPATLLARVEGFFIRNDSKVADNVLRVLTAMNAAEVAVATAMPAVGAARALSDTEGAYDVDVTMSASASLLPNIPIKELQTMKGCFQHFMKARIPPSPPPQTAGGKLWDKFNTGYAFVANERMGLGVSLPVQPESYSLLCTKAGEFVLNSLAAVLEGMHVDAEVVKGIDKAKGVLGAIVGSLPGIFCSPMGGNGWAIPIGDTIKDKSKQSCQGEVDNAGNPGGAQRRFVGGGADGTTVEYLDPDDNKYYSEADWKDRCTKRKTEEAKKKINGAASASYAFVECGAPAKVWEYAVNGNVFMRSFASLKKDAPAVVRDDKGLELTDMDKTGNLSELEELDETDAHAEIYFACSNKWMSGCKSNAMWQLRWRARLRRIQPTDKLIATGLEAIMVATLTQFINEAGGQLGDKLASKIGIPKLIIPKLKDTWYYRKFKNDVVMAGLYGSGAFESAGAAIIRKSDSEGVIH